jgi:hypothetical protein
MLPRRVREKMAADVFYSQSDFGRLAAPHPVVPVTLKQMHELAHLSGYESALFTSAHGITVADFLRLAFKRAVPAT